jgi:Sec-independent protein translocase protein TatA
MNNFDYIVNPTTGKKVKASSSLGKKIIRNYSMISQPQSTKNTVATSTQTNMNLKDVAIIKNSPLISEFKTLIDTVFTLAVDEILNQTQRILTEEQYTSLAMVHFNIMNLTNNTILEEFSQLNVDQQDLSKNHLIILILKCLGMQKDDILSIMPSKQHAGWYGCVEPGLTHQQIEQKSAIQKRRMCQRDAGLPVGRFANNQSCIEAVMQDPTICNPPPTLGQRVQHSAAYAVGRVRSAASGIRQGVESHAPTTLLGFLTFLYSIPDIGVESSVILAVIVVMIFILSGASRQIDRNFVQFMREYQIARERVRQAEERDRRRREREERERREYQRQLDRLRREARERQQQWEQDRHREWMRTNQQRLEALARRERKRIATERMRAAIKKVLSVSKFVRETQVNISDKLRSNHEVNFVSLIGYRVHVIGKGYGSIIDFNPETKKDIISYDVRKGKQLRRPLVKPIVLGTSRTYRKHLTQRVGKAFRIISDINNILVPWPLPRTAVAEDSDGEDAPLARALTETSASTQLLAPQGLVVRTGPLERDVPMAKTITDR